MIYLPLIDSIYHLHYGDVISLPSRTKEIENFDPSFDYKTRMRHQRIYDYIFVHSGEWKLLAHKQGSKLITLANKTNLALQKRLNNSKLPQDEKALAIGMLLGDKTNISYDTKQEFYNLSLSHILCVSGLHIGIICFVLGLCLNIFSLWIANFYILKRILIILIAFALTFVVGLTPSALRVAVMMSFLLLGQITARGQDSMNTLLLTAFVFLVYDPLLLFNLSFEFSFLAVSGILLFMNYRTIILKKIPQNYPLQMVFSSGLATLSAQILVLPISIYYFRRLPTYSLIANMIIVPFLSIVLTTIIVFLCFADIGALNTAISFILHCELLLLKSTVHLLNLLPFAIITV